MKAHKYSDAQLEEYRYINVEFEEWYVDIEREFSGKMREIGIEVTRVFFSFSYSQGDGACFEGYVDDWCKYLDSLGWTDPILQKEATEVWHFSWAHRGRYYHHNSVWFDDEVYIGTNPYDEVHDHLRHSVWDASTNQWDLDKLRKEMIANVKDHIVDLEKQLSKEYDRLLSDESVVEWLEANEIEPELEN